MPQITVSGLTKRYGPTLAVDRLSFEVSGGRVTGFLGPNGAGKTTTLRCLLGLITPSEGEARIMGRRFVELDDPIRTVGASLEATNFHPGRTGRQHLEALAAAGRVRSIRVDRVLDMVELTPAADRRVKGYSMGMRQRLALAAALLGDPPVLVLDEPANGLDPQGMRWLRDVLQAHAARGAAVLLSSHVLAEVAQTVDDVVVIRAGQLIAQSSLAQLTTAGSGTIRVRTARPRELAELLEQAGAQLADGGAPGVLLVRGTTLEVLGDLAAQHQLPVYELSQEAGTLEERFLELTGSGGNVR